MQTPQVGPKPRRYNRRMHSTHRTGRVSATYLILVAAVAAAVGLWLGSRAFAPSAPRLAAAVMYPSPRELPDFKLQRADGSALTKTDWQGHWTVAFFGYTNCPDVCPTTLATFRQVFAKLAADGIAGKVRFDFISVDPQRDTPDVLTKYVGYFDKDFVAATGTDDQLTPLTRALGLMYARNTDANGTISVEHSGAAVIVDPQGREAGILRPPFAARAIANDLATLSADR